MFRDFYDKLFSKSTLNGRGTRSEKLSKNKSASSRGEPLERVRSSNSSRHSSHQRRRHRSTTSLRRSERKHQKSVNECDEKEHKRKAVEGDTRDNKAGVLSTKRSSSLPPRRRNKLENRHVTDGFNKDDNLIYEKQLYKQKVSTWLQHNGIGNEVSPEAVNKPPRSSMNVDSINRPNNRVTSPPWTNLPISSSLPAITANTNMQTNVARTTPIKGSLWRVPHGYPTVPNVPPSIIFQSRGIKSPSSPQHTPSIVNRIGQNVGTFCLKGSLATDSRHIYQNVPVQLPPNVGQMSLFPSTTKATKPSKSSIQHPSMRLSTSSKIKSSKGDKVKVKPRETAKEDKIKSNRKGDKTGDFLSSLRKTIVAGSSKSSVTSSRQKRKQKTKSKLKTLNQVRSEY